MYRVVYSPAAKRDLKRLPAEIQDRVRDVLAKSEIGKMFIENLSKN